MTGKYRHGDIAIYGPDGKNTIQDFFIRSSSQKTHITYFVNDTEVVEAVRGKGVIKSKFKELDHINVYRNKSISRRQAMDGSIEGLKLLGDKYSVFQAVCAGVLRIIGLSHYAEKIDKNWFCSELVAHQMQYGWEIDYFPEPNRSVLPDDILEIILKENWEKIL